VFDEEVDAVNELAAFYDAELAGLANVKTPVIPEGFLSSRAQYTLRLKNAAARDGLKAHLEANGVPTMIYFPIPMHKQKAFAGTRSEKASCPVTEKLCSTVLSIPMHPYMNEADRQKVVEHIKEFLR
jgi:dTDP-4-amino-4,6-dideoxygalactose transaminase